MGWCTKLDLHDLLENGHHLARTPDGECDDFNMAIADYISKSNGDSSECEENGETEVVSCVGTVDAVEVRYAVHGAVYESGKTIDGEFIAKGKLVKEESNCVIFDINEIKKV